MNWTQVTIPPGSNAAADGTALMNAYSRTHFEVGAPQDATVWRASTTDGGLVFYFSPSASSLAKAIFVGFQVAVLASAPDSQTVNQVFT